MKDLSKQEQEAVERFKKMSLQEQAEFLVLAFQRGDSKPGDLLSLVSK